MFQFWTYASVWNPCFILNPCLSYEPNVSVLNPMFQFGIQSFSFEPNVSIFNLCFTFETKVTILNYNSVLNPMCQVLTQFLDKVVFTLKAQFLVHLSTLNLSFQLWTHIVKSETYVSSFDSICQQSCSHWMFSF